VPIHFNAWHYLDADLWASLVTEVFDRLFEHIAPQLDQSDELKRELQKAKGLFGHAERELGEAKAARDRAEQALKTAVAERDGHEREHARELDDAESLLRQDPDVAKALGEFARALGKDDLARSVTAVQEKAAELRALGGRLGLFLQATLRERGGVRLWALALVLLLPVLVAGLLDWLAPRLAGIHALAVQVSTLLAGVTGWLAVQLKRGTALADALEQANARLAERRKERLAAGTSVEMQAVQAARQREAAARQALHDAELRVRAIEGELADAAPGRRIYRFIEERARSAEYRSRLGIVSLVRRDFEHLTRLFELGRKDPAIRRIMPVERIILYIDDLDRCKTDRVIEVLEAVHLLLAFRLFMVVVAVDPRWLRRCLEQHYPDLLASRTEQPTALGDVLPSRPPTAQDYLEKIFQVPFTLQPLRGEGFRKMVRGLAAPKVASAAPGTAQPPTPTPSVGGPAGDRPDPAPPTPNPTGTSPTTTDDLPPPDEAETIERLTITAHELHDIQRLAGLFRTPRTVKRFVNTYRFLRASLPPDERQPFVGDEQASGEYQAVLVLLAIVVSYPGIAQAFLQRLTDFGAGPRNRTWSAFLDSVDLHRGSGTGAKRRPAGHAVPATPPSAAVPSSWEAVEWRQLVAALRELSERGFPPRQLAPFVRWLPRVARYSFSLSSLLSLRR
jgi:hypothetical protein